MPTIVVKATAEISRDGKTITFTETTGAYSGSNTSGYGMPNLDITDFIRADLTVTPPSGVPTTYNILASGFPSATNGTYDIVSATPFADGIYTFFYEIEDNTGDIYDVTVIVGFYYNITVCIYKKICKLKLEDCNCDCSNDLLAHIAQMYIYFEKLKIEAAFGRVDAFNETLVVLQRMCAYEPCNC